jgi:hypothetical protein
LVGSDLVAPKEGLVVHFDGVFWPVTRTPKPTV